MKTADQLTQKIEELCAMLSRFEHQNAGPRTEHESGLVASLVELKAALEGLQRAPEVVHGDRAARSSTSEGPGHYRELVELAPDVVYRLAPDGTIVSLSAAFEELTGWPAAEWIGKPFAGLVHPDDLPLAAEQFQRGIAGETIGPFELRIRTKTGEYRVGEFRSAPKIEHGRVIGKVGIARDITERKRLEAALLESEQRYRLALEAGQMGVWEWTIATGEVVWSPNLETMHGLPSGSFGGRFEDFERTIHPQDREAVLEAIRRAITEDVEYHIEYRTVWPDGSVHWSEARGQVFRDEQQRPVRMTGICTDITERKRAQEALQESERRYRALLEALDIPVYTTDAEGRITLFNEAAVRLWGRRPQVGEDQWCGSWRLYWPDGRPMPHDQCPMAMALKEGRPIRGLEAIVERPDGSRTFMLPHPTPLRDSSGALIGVVNVLMDISEHKRIEQQLEQRLRELEEIYLLSKAIERAEDLEHIYTEAMEGLQRALQTDRIGILLFDPDGVMRWKAWKGLSEDYRNAVEGHTPWSPETKDPAPVLVSDVEREASFWALREAVLSEDIRSLAFFPLVYKDQLLGKVMVYYRAPHEFTADELRLTQTIASHVGFAIGRKRAEQGLALYREVITHSQEAIAMIDPAGRYLEQNDAHRALVGYTDAELRGKTPAIHLGEQVFEQIASELVKTGRFRGEVVSSTKSGEEREIDLSAFAVKDERGEVLCYVGIKRDITERKRAERELLARARQQAAVAALGQRALAGTDLMTLMDEAAALVAETLEVPYCSVLELLLEGDRLLLRAGFGWKDEAVGQITVSAGRDSQAGYTLLSGGPVIVEDLRTETRFPGSALLHEHRVLSGVSVIIHGRERPSGRSRPFGVLGAYTTEKRRFTQDDVYFLQAIANCLAMAIERKRAEDELRFQKALLESQNEASIDGNIVVSPEGTVISFNQRFIELWGIPGEVMVTRSNEAVLRAMCTRLRDPEAFLARVAYLHESPTETVRQEIELKDGRWFEWYSTPVYGEDGTHYGRRRSFRDITWRKRAELRITRLQALTSALSEALTRDDVVRVITEEGMAQLGARAGWIAVRTEDGTTLETLAAFGFPAERLEEWKRIPLAAAVPLAEVTRTGEPLIFGTQQALRERYRPMEGSSVTAEDHALVALPLAIEGRTIGAIGLRFSEEKEFSPEDRDFLVALAQQCAQALERARLYEAERRARDLAEAAQDRLAFLAEASMALSASLDYQTTLANIATLAVPNFADWCTVDILDENSQLQRLAAAHVDPAKVALAQEVEQRYPPDRGRAQTLTGILATGEPGFYPEVTDGHLRDWARDEEHLRALRELGVTSVIIVPLMVRGQTLGLITFVSARPERRYGPADLALAEELARRASVAVENARLYQEAQRVQAELRSASEAKDEFLGIISHELRNPVTTIYGGLSLLRSRGAQLSEDVKAGILVDMEDDVDQLQQLITDMLVLSRLELGRPVSAEPVLVPRVIKRIVSSFQRRRPGRPFVLSLEEGLPPAAAEPVYVEQVLRNLLSNADKYSPASSPIEVRAQRHGQHEVMVSVLDRGPGVPPEDTERIFERFYRSSSTKAVSGTGIGLTVCKRLVEAQSGRIWARLREGGGLEVSFTIPLYNEEEE